MKIFTVNSNDQGQRLDKFLLKTMPRMNLSLLYKYIRLKRIKVNGKKSEINYKLLLGDEISLYINDEFFQTDSKTDFLSVPSHLDILYEDDQLLLVDKKVGMVVHEDNDNTVDTLINRVLHYLYDKGEYRPADELSFAPALCNRIDRNTGGIVLVAKTAPALRILNEKIKSREIKKHYLCAVSGIVTPKAGQLTHYLTKDSQKNQVTVHEHEVEGSKIIITKYQVRSCTLQNSLVEVELVTGRTHQIRAHFAYIGHPLLGDGKYGSNAVNKRYHLKYQALYSYKVDFTFETDAQELNYLRGKSFSIPNIWFADEFQQKF